MATVSLRWVQDNASRSSRERAPRTTTLQILECLINGSTNQHIFNEVGVI
jgi:hypothetical protein